MQIVITSKKPLLDDRFGRLVDGQTVDMVEHKALFYVARGDAVRYETKVQQDRPLQAAGETTPSSALPAAPALPPQTLPPSETGARKRIKIVKRSS
jgi:hypothetical protein